MNSYTVSWVDVSAWPLGPAEEKSQEFVTPRSANAFAGRLKNLKRGLVRGVKVTKSKKY